MCYHYTIPLRTNDIIQIFSDLSTLLSHIFHGMKNLCSGSARACKQSPNSGSAVENFAIDGDRDDLPRKEFPARAQRLPRRVFESATARHLHAHDGNAPEIVATDDLRELVGIVHRVELRAADERDLPFHEFTVHVRVGIRRAVGRNEQFRALKIRRVDRHELDLARPLAKLRRLRHGSLRLRCLLTADAAHPAAGTAAGVRRCALRLLFAHIRLHGRSIIGSRLALNKVDA